MAKMFVVALLLIVLPASVSATGSSGAFRGRATPRGYPKSDPKDILRFLDSLQNAGAKFYFAEILATSMAVWLPRIPGIDHHKVSLFYYTSGKRDTIYMLEIHFGLYGMTYRSDVCNDGLKCHNRVGEVLERKHVQPDLTPSALKIILERLPSKHYGPSWHCQQVSRAVFDAIPGHPVDLDPLSFLKEHPLNGSVSARA